MPENGHDIHHQIITFFRTQAAFSADKMDHSGIFLIELLPGGTVAGLHMAQLRTVGRIR